MSGKSTKNLKVIFAPGSFDNFEGTQEELDELVKEIEEGVKDGSFFDRAESIDFDDFADGSMVEEDLETLKLWLENADFTDYTDGISDKRKLH